MGDGSSGGEATTGGRIGVLASSAKENERRLPIHPEHLADLPPHVRGKLWFETGYGERFGFSDEELAELSGGVADQDALFEDSDVVLLPKPTVDDVSKMHAGQTLWGWAHLVQDAALTQAAIDRGISVVAWEDMYAWDEDGNQGPHTFGANNELAGYSSVMHALQLKGRTGQYGPPLSAAIIGFGSTGRGALKALDAMGVARIDVLSARDIAEPLAHRAEVRTFQVDPDSSRSSVGRRPQISGEPMSDFLLGHDIVVNCVLQDPTDPAMFLERSDVEDLDSELLVVDVSCDEGMGFEWAVPTTFEEPMFRPAPKVDYYAVDHSPSLYADSATWEISRALLPFVELMTGPSVSGADDPTLTRAFAMDSGRILDERILRFQNRSEEAPHRVLN